MSDPAGTRTDGTPIFGTQVANINNVLYVCDKIDIKSPQKTEVQNNQFGVPAQKLHQRTCITGDMTVQLANAATPLPPQFANFTLVSVNNVTLHFIVTEPDLSQTDGITKCPVTFEENLNP